MPSFQLANLSGIGLTVGFLVVGVLAGLWLALLAWRFRDSDYVRYVFGSAVFVVLALLAHLYELLDASFQGSVMAYYGIHMAFPYIAAFLALFTLSYIGARWWENPWVLVAIFAVPVALTLLLPFDASLHFFDLRHTLDRSLLYWPVQYEHGIGVVILVIYDISMVGIALVSVLGFAIRVSRRYLPQIVVLSVSITAPYITSVLNMYHLVFMGEYLVTPAFGLIFSVLGLLWAALRWGLFEATPPFGAKDRPLETMRCWRSARTCAWLMRIQPQNTFLRATFSGVRTSRFWSGFPLDKWVSIGLETSNTMLNFVRFMARAPRSVIKSCCMT